jgi:hypothetical protein
MWASSRRIGDMGLILEVDYAGDGYETLFLDNGSERVNDFETADVSN